ncbi:MAG: GNAT family N-acetyltransferase [Chloroflexi bacterium]|nr:MAG: GNAT family N-acetyltransferase [Chloroflexota bacterium]
MNLTPCQFAQMVEETSLNAWPALQQILLDGWILRFANGYSRRNNSVNAVYPGCLPVAQKIARSEGIFRRKNLPPTFRMTPFVQPDDLDARLAAAGYQKVSPTSVQTAELSGLPPPSPHLDVEWHAAPEARWVQTYTHMNGVPVHKHATLRQILAHIPLDSCYLTVQHNGRPVACGLAVLQPPLVGLFDIVTDPAQRRRGFGRELVLQLLHWARQRGAEHAYLQVVAQNAPAIGLYSGLGFREIYQYWYRVIQ